MGGEREEARKRMRGRKGRKNQTEKEYIYALKEIIWIVFFLPLESKSKFWVLKTTFSFLFFFSLLLTQFFFRMEMALYK